MSDKMMQAHPAKATATKHTGMDELMSNVTGAVFKAEGSIKDAIFNYAKLVAAEQAIVDHPNAREADKITARDGVENAQKILDGLKKLFNWSIEET